MKSIYCAALLTLLSWPAPGVAEEIRGFDPGKSCVETLSNTGGTTDQFMLAAWVFGYLAAQNGTLRPVTIDNNKVVLENVTKACIGNPSASLLDLVAASKPSQQGSTPAQPGPSETGEAAARALLSQFLEPGADRHALTQALLPRPEDVRAVYGEPLATQMIATYAEHLTPNVAIGPKPGQTNLLTWYATTAELKQGAPILDEFPGGYDKVRGYMLGAHPIVRFKFVEQGETLGMAFDGLIHVNGRWVWMPKPWRSLGN